MKTPQYRLHLIANAHLDPVWLWDWREGLNEAWNTCKTVLDLMDEDQEMTFIRGEAAVYQHIERHDPATFKRIIKMIDKGRWDVVGGTYIQPDTNLPATETFCRHFQEGKRYFRDRFGVEVTAAWAADSFGHGAGLPEIMAAAGMQSFAFTRPFAPTLTLAKPAFWWEGSGGSRILSYRPLVGWYGSNRDEVIRRLDETLPLLEAVGLRTVGFFYGLGNHGGGPTRPMLADFRAWGKAHPEVEIVHSGLHQFFSELREEAAGKPVDFLPVHAGELNFCLRGCYSSVAKFKFAYRSTEALLTRAEQTRAIIGMKNRIPAADLGGAWKTVLFNSFHDILPGSSIERAMNEQIEELGGAAHDARSAELDALNALAADIDTRVTAVKGDEPSGVSCLVWNPHPWEYVGPVEIEAAVDYRPIAKYEGRPKEMPVQLLGPNRKPTPFQVIETEHTAMRTAAWRKRLATPVRIPAFGYAIHEISYVEEPKLTGLDIPATGGAENFIHNEHYRIEAAEKSSAIRILRDGKSIFGDAGLTFNVFEDRSGSWGGMAEEADSIHFKNALETWTIAKAIVLESGPYRSKMWVKLVGKQSWIELAFCVYAGRDAVDVAARVMWNERCSRLKMSMPAGERAEFEVPGARVIRGALGEVPGGKWVRVLGRENEAAMGFASDAIYSFDCRDDALRATICRASRYADDATIGPEAEPWLPVVDAGELKFRFLLNAGGEDLPRLADELAQPVTVLEPLVPHAGELPRSGSLLSMEPEQVELLSMQPAEKGRGLVLRVRNAGKQSVKATVRIGKDTVKLEEILGNRIQTFVVQPSNGGWKAKAVLIGK